MSAKQYVDLPGITVYDEEIKEYIEDKSVDLTYAEYQALPSSKLSDNVNYHITDVTPVVGTDINDSVVASNKVWSSQKVNAEFNKVVFSDAVECAIDDTSCTIEDARITATSIVEPFCDAVTPPVIDSTTITTGQVVIALHKPLTAVTNFRVRITNL